MPAIDFPGDLIRDIAAVFGAAGALIALNAAFRDVYRRTIGRRRDRYRRLARLGTGAQLSFFESVLGEPPAIRRSVIKKNFSEYLSSDDPRYRDDADVQKVFYDKTFLECIFIDRDYFVQTISDDDESVLAFSVTTRSPRFHPAFQLPSKVGWRERRQWKRRTGEEFKAIFRIRLGQTRFADLDRGDPDEFTGIHFKAWRGARTFSYSEDHYYGNPGYYQTFVFTTSSNTRLPGGIGDLGGVIQEAGGEEWPDQSREDQREWKDMPMTQAFRRKSAITTYSVIGVGLSLDNYPSQFRGPNGDDVRTLP